MPVYKWSQTAASNASADPTINYAEGQTPGSLNDSGRAEMAALKMYVDDISGAIITGGTSTAYTVASYSVFSSLALMSGQMIAFTPHVINGATVTLNVDGLGAKPLRPAPSVELQSNMLIAGTPYFALYNSSDAVFYLHGNAGGTYGIPLGGGMPYFGTTAPSSAFVFPAGQAISRLIYATCFSLFGTSYGSGDGATTFNVPDLTGRVLAVKEATATRLTTAGGGVDGGTLGAVGGSQNGTIAQGNLPSVTLTTNITDPGHTHTVSGGTFGGTGVAPQSGSTVNCLVGATGITIDPHATGITASTPLGGSGTAFKLVQPTFVTNFILRII